MAKRHESALRQHRRSLKAKDRNQRNVARVRTALKSFRALLDEKTATDAQKRLPVTLSLLDHSVSLKALHKNAVARLKSRLTRQARAIGAK